MIFANGSITTGSNSEGTLTIGGFGRITPLQGDMLSLGGLVLGRSGEMEAGEE